METLDKQVSFYGSRAVRRHDATIDIVVSFHDNTSEISIRIRTDRTKVVWTKRRYSLYGMLLWIESQKGLIPYYYDVLHEMHMHILDFYDVSPDFRY